MQAGASFATPWRESKTATVEVLEEPASLRSEVPSRIFRFLRIWEETLSIAGKYWKGPELTGAIGTSAISQDIENLLKWLIENNVRLIGPNEIRQYLLTFPDLIEVVPVTVSAACERLPQAQLVLQVYYDPEIDDSYLAIYVRLKKYDELVMEKIENAEAEFLDLLADKNGWLQLTTDFREPEGTHAL